MVKNGSCGTFDFLDAALGRFLVMLVRLELLATFPMGAEKLSHTPHKLFLRIIIPDIDQNSMLAETILKNLVNIETGIRSYRIDVGE